MNKEKSSKLINQVKSSLYSFSKNPSISMPGEEKKIANNKSRNLNLQEKPPNEAEKQSGFKSSFAVRSLKIPSKKTSDVIDCKEKRRAELSPILFNSSGNDLEIIHNTKSSISPKLLRQLSPLSDSVYEPKRTNLNLNKGKQGKIMLRHLKIDKELYLNHQTFKASLKFNPRPCLEDIIILNESKELTNFAFIEKNLRVCTQIIINLMCRMEEIGKKTEALLLDSFWKHLIETIDETIEAFTQNQKNIQFTDKIADFNLSGSMKSNYFEPQSWENEEENMPIKQDKVERSIEKMQNYFESLTSLSKNSAIISETLEKNLKFLERGRKRTKDLSEEESLENPISVKDF